MANDGVTLNIRGNFSSSNSGGGGTPPLQQPYAQPPSAPMQPQQGASLPSYDRMSEDIRRELKVRGAYMIPGQTDQAMLLNTIKDEKKKEYGNDFEAYYKSRKDDIYRRQDAAEAVERERVSREIDEKFSDFDLNVKWQRDTVEIARQEAIGLALNPIDKKFEAERQALFEEKDSERARIEEDLTRAVEDLVDELKRGYRSGHRTVASVLAGDLAAEGGGGGPGGPGGPPYNPDDPDGNGRAMAVAALMRRGGVITGITTGVSMANRILDAYRNNTFSKISELQTAANGDMIGMLQQDLERQRQNNAAAWGTGGGILGAIVGAAITKSVAGAGWGTGIGSALGTGLGNFFFNWSHFDEEAQLKLAAMWQQQEQRVQQYNELALVTRGMTGGGKRRANSLEEERDEWLNAFSLGNLVFNPDVNSLELGYTGSQFAQIIAQRIKQRGFFAGKISGSGHGLTPWYDLAEGAPERVRDAYISKEEEERKLREDAFAREHGVARQPDLEYKPTTPTTENESEEQKISRVANLHYHTNLPINIADYVAQQIALERVYNMSEGSLAQLSSYDRYTGVRGANDDFAKIVHNLSSLGTLGMSGGQTLRSNEFMGYYTNLLEMQKQWMLSPNSNYAMSLLFGAQKAFGNNLDERALSTIGKFENAVRNPNQDYSQQILFDVIQEMNPNVRGDWAGIQRMMYSNDPKVAAEINKRAIRRIQQIYGDTESAGGLGAFRQFYNEANPLLLDKGISIYENFRNDYGDGNAAADAKKIKGYTSDTSKEFLSTQDATSQQIWTELKQTKELVSGFKIMFENKLRELISSVKDLSK